MEWILLSSKVMEDVRRSRIHDPEVNAVSIGCTGYMTEVQDRLDGIAQWQAPCEKLVPHKHVVEWHAIVGRLRHVGLERGSQVVAVGEEETIFSEVHPCQQQLPIPPFCLRLQHRKRRAQSGIGELNSHRSGSVIKAVWWLAGCCSGWGPAARWRGA